MFPEIVQKIIEEFTDGFMILNSKKDILFFNDVLLEFTGWNSIDVLNKKEEFLKLLKINTSANNNKTVNFPFSGQKREYMIGTTRIINLDAIYFLIFVRLLNKSNKDGLNLLNNQYEHLFNNLGDPLVTVNLKNEIISANPAFSKLLNYDNAALPKKITSIYVYKKALKAKLQDLFNNESICNLETHLYTKDGVRKKVIDSSWVIKDEKGKIIGYTTQFKDVSTFINLKERIKISERNYVNLFDTIMSSLIILDLDGKILNCNHATEELYEYTWEELHGTSFDTLINKNNRYINSINRLISLIKKNNGRYIESGTSRLCKKGKIKYTYSSYSSIKNSSGKLIAYLILEKDLTDKVKLEKKLQESFRQIRETQSAAILGFAKLTEYRDKDTGKHLERIKEYTRVLAVKLKQLPKYMDYISSDYIEDLCLSSILHDIGKVGIVDSILHKQGRLNDDEFNAIKEHARLGGDALKEIDKELKRESFLTIGKEVAYYHHERWDGTGYPTGKKGEEIPLSARIVALADVYDALTSKRTYKDAYSHKKAIDIIESERGTHFDPEIVDVLLKNHKKFEIIKRFEDLCKDPEVIRNKNKKKA